MLKAGLALGALGVAAGGSIWWRRGLVHNHLSESGREVFRGVARGVLSDVLPLDPQARNAALDAHLLRIDAFVSQMSPALRQELGLLIGALANLPSRLLLTGMATAWRDASDAQVQHALESLRTASSSTNKSIYHGLRDLVCMTYFGVPQTWGVTGYPGPKDV